MRSALGVLLLALAATSVARATVIVPIDFNELAVTADAVVYARVTDVRSLVTDDRRRVESIVVLEAIGYMKGNLGRRIAFRVPGGQVGAYRTVMVGAPSFARGDEVVLFLASRRPGPIAGTRAPAPYIVGFGQGVYRVRVDERTGARVVVPPPAISGSETVRLARGTRSPMPLESFAAQVRALAAGSAR